MNKWKRGEGKQTGWRRAETKKDDEDEEKHCPPRGGGVLFVFLALSITPPRNHVLISLENINSIKALPIPQS